MKILWFANIGASLYGGGGWISALRNELQKNDDIELAICCQSDNGEYKTTDDGIVYYRVLPYRRNQLQKMQMMMRKELYSENDYSSFIQQCISVVKDFNPELIHIFGSEAPYGLIAKYITNKPIVLHIQGILNPVFNAFLPPSFSKKDFLFAHMNPITLFQKKYIWDVWKETCLREKDFLRHIKYFIGRTEWDKKIVSLFSDSSKYYYGSEILRETFYIEENRKQTAELKIVSVISSPLYKGYDLILKTAKILKENGFHNFEWNVFGNVDTSVVGKKIGIKSSDVNVIIKGRVDENQLKKSLLEATLYIHPSYIENSSNGICEAQISGCPVIATNVGGTSSLVNDNETGYLVPANDSYFLASLIKYLYKNKSEFLRVGYNAQRVALKRHDREAITAQLIDTYKSVITDYKSKNKDAYDN